jgi:hypothetical protein
LVLFDFLVDEESTFFGGLPAAALVTVLEAESVAVEGDFELAVTVDPAAPASCLRRRWKGFGTSNGKALRGRRFEFTCALTEQTGDKAKRRASVHRPP